MMTDYTEDMKPMLCFQTNSSNKVLSTVSSPHGNVKAIQELNRVKV